MQLGIMQPVIMSVVSALQVIIHAAVWLSVIADEREKWVDLD